ncbi:hypothetical protein ACWEQG_02010 [Microbispora sp. NPDC004025]
MPDELIGIAVTLQERQLAALEQTHPGWRIQVTGGEVRWWATRRRPPTLPQLSAGVVSTVGRETPEALAQALAMQDEIAHRIR